MVKSQFRYRALFLASTVLMICGVSLQTYAAGKGGSGKPGSQTGTPNAEILYTDVGGVLKVAQPDGSGQTALTDGSGTDNVFSRASWTTDGSGLLFAANLPNPGIFFQAFNNSTGLASGAPVLLTNMNDRFFGNPRMSPGPSVDGKVKIVFSDLNSNNTYDLFLMNADGSDVYQLSTLDGVNDYFARWSPSSDKLVVTSLSPGDFETIQIIDLVYNAITGKIEEAGRIDLTGSTFGLDPTVADPVWSPDGQSIVISADINGPRDLYRIPIANPALYQNLTDTPDISETAPSFSPDGTQLVYQAYAPTDPCSSSKRNKSVQGIAVRNIDGSPIGLCYLNMIVNGAILAPDWRSVAP